MLVHVPNFFPAAKRLRVPDSWKDPNYLDPSGEISVGSFYSSIDYLLTNKAMWHTDKGHPPYSALVVVKNTGVAVQTWGKPSVVGAPGDLIYLNIHKKHRAVQVAKKGRLLVLVQDYHKQVSLDEIKKDYREVFQQFQAQVPRDVRY